MTLKEMLHERREEIRKVAARHGVFEIRVFGSIVRGEENPQSDVDFLVKAGGETSAWFPGGLIADLEGMLDRRVEVVTENGLNPLIRERVIREAVPL